MKLLSTILAAILLFSIAAKTQTSNDLSDAEIQGRNLVQQLRDARPEQNFTNSGTLLIRNPDGTKTNFPVKFEITTCQTNWQNIFTVSFVHYDTNNSFGWRGEIVTITHTDNEPIQYQKIFAFTFGRKFQGHIADVGPNGRNVENLSAEKTFIPFGQSDFWICDLGLEFFHWPEQKILPKTTNLKRGRDYTLLESTNPNPSANGYSRVLTWIDKETGGILAAETYDAQGKLLKEFEPKSFKKVNGQWELQEMEIRNVQTGSRTRLEFDLNK